MQLLCTLPGPHGAGLARDPHAHISHALTSTQLLSCRHTRKYRGAATKQCEQPSRCLRIHAVIALLPPQWLGVHGRAGVAAGASTRHNAVTFQVGRQATATPYMRSQRTACACCHVTRAQITHPPSADAQPIHVHLPARQNANSHPQPPIQLPRLRCMRPREIKCSRTPPLT